jgi:hypothetical protein
MAYDILRRRRSPGRASREYLQILAIAAKDSEESVDDALCLLIHEDRSITVEAVEEILLSGSKVPALKDVRIEAVDLGIYDGLLEPREVACASVES